MRCRLKAVGGESRRLSTSWFRLASSDLSRPYPPALMRSEEAVCRCLTGGTMTGRSPGRKPLNVSPRGWAVRTPLGMSAGWKATARSCWPEMHLPRIHLPRMHLPRMHLPRSRCASVCAGMAKVTSAKTPISISPAKLNPILESQAFLVGWTSRASVALSTSTWNLSEGSSFGSFCPNMISL